MKPIVISTIADYASKRYSVSTRCWKCQTYGELDLVGLCGRGYGKTPLSAYRPKCSCGEPLQLTVSPPTDPGGRPDFLIRKP